MCACHGRKKCQNEENNKENIWFDLSFCLLIDREFEFG
jgi:hypothetical protein